MQRIDNVLGPLSQYITKENRRKKDIIKYRRVLWLIQLKRYLKNKNYHIRRWEQYCETHNKQIDKKGNEYFYIAWIKRKEWNPREYDHCEQQIIYHKHGIIDQYHSIGNFQK